MALPNIALIEVLKLLLNTLMLLTAHTITAPTC